MMLMAGPLTAAEQRTNDRLAWFSRIMRWSLGLLFIGAGIYFYKDGAWPAILFGSVLFVTGFFRPKRCLDEDGCEIPRP